MHRASLALFQDPSSFFLPTFSRICFGDVLEDFFMIESKSILQDRFTALLRTCRKGHTRTVLLLLENKADLEQADKVCMIDSRQGS